MKAWIVCNMNERVCDVMKAETSARARYQFALNWGEDMYDVFKGHVKISVQRAPACDQIEGSDDRLALEALRAGYLDWIMLGCGCTIDQDDDITDVVFSNNRSWCCTDHRSGVMGGAKGSRHWA